MENKIKNLQISKVMKVNFKNPDIGLLSKEFDMKFGGIIKQYETFLFTKFQRKNMCFVKVMKI